MEYITVKKASQKWGISARRAQELCKQGKVSGAVLWERTWMIPKDAEKPADSRRKGTAEQKPVVIPERNSFMSMTNTGISGMKYSQKVYDIRVDVTKTSYNTINATFYVDGVKTEHQDLTFEFVNVYGEGSSHKPTGGATTGGDSTSGLVTAAAMLGGIIAVAAVFRKKR